MWGRLPAAGCPPVGEASLPRLLSGKMPPEPADKISVPHSQTRSYGLLPKRKNTFGCGGRPSGKKKRAGFASGPTLRTKSSPRCGAADSRLHYTHSNHVLHLTNVDRLTGPPFPHSHQFWGQELTGLYTLQTQKVPSMIKKRRKSPVTIVIGIKCKRSNGIVVVCDSRTTDPLGYFKDNVLKLHAIEFKNGHGAILAEAGNAEFSGRAIEIISQTAKDQDFTDYRAAASCAESAVADLKQKIRAQYQGTAEELQKHFEAYAFELMIAHYWQGNPYIFTLSFVTGIASKKDGLYCAIGCGWVLADFVISRLDLTEFGTAQGMWTAVYAVEEIKKLDLRCGGRTRAALITDEKGISKAVVLEDDKAMAETIDEALDFSEWSKAQWQQTSVRRIERVIARRTHKH